MNTTKVSGKSRKLKNTFCLATSCAQDGASGEFLDLIQSLNDSPLKQHLLQHYTEKNQNEFVICHLRLINDNVGYRNNHHSDCYK